MMRREPRYAPLGPYYVKAGKAGPMPQGSQKCEKHYGPGKPKPCLSGRPDTWPSWPRLLPTLLPTDGAMCSASVKPSVSSGQRIPGCMPACVVLPRASARAQEDAEWLRFAKEWLHRLQGSLSVAPLFCELGELAQESFLRVLQGKAPATLRRHLVGWKLWSSFALEQGWSHHDPTAHELIVFFMALAESKRESPAAMAAQKFVAAILGWASWLRTLENPVVLAWCGNKRRQRARKEALPLPLYVVAAFEQAVLQAHPIGAEHAKDVRLLTAFLLMLWGALRYSDLQRVLVGELCCEDGVVRGACWRTKSSASGMPFGVLTLGIIGNWTYRAQELINFMKECDFLIAGPQGFRASFSYVLGHLRRLLIQIAGVPANMAAAYALHSLKTTPLSWALQLEVASDARRAWGHHRAKESGAAMVAKYSRDDVLPALRAQFHVIKAVRAGWTPWAPQARGGLQPLQELPLPQVQRDELVAPPWLATFRGADDSDETASESDSGASSCSSTDLDATSESEEIGGAAHQRLHGAYVVNQITLFATTQR